MHIYVNPYLLLLLLSTSSFSFIPQYAGARAGSRPRHSETELRAKNLAPSSGQKVQRSVLRLIAQAQLDSGRKRLTNEAKQLNEQAFQLYKQGQFSEAIPIAQRALSIFEKVHGTDHPVVATSLNNLAELYSSQGLYSKAEPIFQRSLSIRETALGLDHLDVAISLYNLAGLYASQGLYSKANPLYQRSLSIREKALGSDHLDVAQSLNGLAFLYASQGLYPKAKPLYLRSLTIRKKKLGPDHPDVANSLNNLAGLYDSQGLYSKAEPLYQRSLSIREKALGLDHPDVATNLKNLAALYYSQGLYSKAAPLYQRSLSIEEKSLGSDHPSFATSLNNFAVLYDSQGLYSEAELLYLRSLTIRKKTLGPDHPDVAQSLNNLAGLYYSEGFYAKAEPLYQRSLSIREKTLGLDHPDVAISLNNLATIYRDQSLYSKAEPFYKRSLSIIEKNLGPDHPDVATNLSNLADLHALQGNSTLVHELLSRSLDIQERNIELTFSTGSESRKRAYLSTLSGKTDSTISNHLNDSPDSLPSTQLALTTILRRKGRILESLTDSFHSLRQHLPSANRPLLDQLIALRSRRATLTFQGPGQLSPEQHQTTIAKLKTQENELENQLARKSSKFRAENQPVTILAVQQQIPQGAALVELVKYRPFITKATNQEKKWEVPHYAAYLLKADGEIQWVNLGEAAPIDEAVTEFRQVLKSSSSNIKPTARKLDQRLMQPIRAKLGNTKQLFLSPDSQLNLIPFAALVDENNQYLVQNYSITYLSSGRDFLKLQATTQANKQSQVPVIIANPDYQQPGDSPKIAIVPTGKNRSSRDLNLNFGPLPGTKEEAKQLFKLLPQSKLLTQTQATENALKQVQSPEILHIATHGFFLETDLEAVLNPSEKRASIGVVSKKQPQDKQRNYENPLLRSGLALAGANPRQSGTEDGIFTALEATGLNLLGTKLVVLSACETGLGDLAEGDGVYGLRRAFVLAGAESQVLSLWKVSDVGTKDLMVNYYQRLLNKEGRGEALRQTQLEMLGNKKYQHPFYWAAFIPSGDWTALNSR